MDKSICDNIEDSSLATSGSSEQVKTQLNSEFINIDNGTIHDVSQQQKITVTADSNDSEASKNSSDAMEVDVSPEITIKDIESSDVTINNKDEDETDSTNDTKKFNNIRRFRTIIDSDTDDEEVISSESSKSKSIDIEGGINKLTEKSKSSKLRIDSDSDDDIKEPTINNNTNNQSDEDDEPVIKKKSKKFSDLIDSDSDSESDNINKNYSSFDVSSKNSSEHEKSQKKLKKEKSEKKRTGTKRAAKDEAMRQIHSETQRLIREAPVSLPYHRPKQRSLKEFLNRKKIAPIIPQASTAAAKLKMSAAIVNEVVKEKEKEAELFYKSSDSEDDETPTSNQTENAQTNSSFSSTTSAFVPIEETQKLHKIDIQNAQNKKQIIQQGNLELGAPRKLFFDDIKDPIVIEPVDAPEVDPKVNNDEGNKQMIECEEDSHENILRKLSNNSEDSSGGLFEGFNSIASNSTVIADNNTINTQVMEETIRSSDVSPKNNTSSDGNNSGENKTSEIIDISSLKSSENLQEKHQHLLQNEKIIDLTATQSTSTSHASISSPENSVIHNTSLLSNEKIQELNNDNLNSEKSSRLSNERFIDDDSQSSEPDCGVVGLPPPIFDCDKELIKPPQIAPVISKKSILINAPKLKPKLRGTPGAIIDLTQNLRSNKAAVDSLVDRFLSKHSVINKHSESNSELTVIQTEVTNEGLKVFEDVLPYKLPSAIDSIDDDLNKPGAKLKRFKEEMEKQMVNKRNEEWKQREKQLMLDEEELEDNEENIEFEPEDKDEPSAVNDEASDEESEPEENDVLISDKKRKTCAFGDDEAEVDEDKVMDLSDDENEEDEEEEEDKEEDVDLEEEESEDINEVNDTQEKRKKFSRIVAADDDSNSEEETVIEDVTRFERKRTDVDMFEDDEEGLGFSEKTLQESPLTPIFKTPLTPNHRSNSLESRSSQFSSLSFNSPDFNLNSNNINSQLSDWQSQSNSKEIKNKLYDTQDRNVTDEELMALCSGKFTDDDSITQNDNRPRLTGLIDSASGEKPVTDSQIISMCSGTFSSQPLLSSTDLSGNVDETSQDIRLTFDDSSQNSNDNILDKKLEAENNLKIQSSIQSFLDIASSDDETENKTNSENKNKVLKKKKVKQLVLSDDEDEEMNEEDRSDVEDEVEDVESDADEEKFVDYDSEENEVVVSKKDLKKVAANFVDAEAELSESEWGSEDEDEKDMDKLELEEGDVEEIDEDRMRAQLGKLHARQVLDDDQRDVRMLKEMLFEDGDLHTDGAGRERRFKWRNIDKIRDENFLGPTNDDDHDNQLDPTELTNELEWRKLRLEREKFLEEKMRSDGDLDRLDNDIEFGSGGKLLKMKMKVLKKSETIMKVKNGTVDTEKPIIPRTVSDLISTPDRKTRILHSAMKRGSFLARGDEALARLAVRINKSDTVDLAPKHSKNFLFTHISPSVNGKDDDDNDDENNAENMREGNGENNDKLMRKRKFATGGTPRTAKKSKIDTNRSSGKKLF